MRAVALDGDGLPELVEWPEPAGPGLLVKVRGCGLCGSDAEELGAGTRGILDERALASRSPLVVAAAPPLPS